MTGRGRRATRSASRDIASSPPEQTTRITGASRSPTRRSMRNDRAASQDLDDVPNDLPARSSRESAESTGSTNSRAGRTTRKQNQTTVTDLATVEEVQETQTSDEAEIEEQLVNDSTGVVSNLSGTTALESQSLSQQDISDLSPVNMLDSFSDLMEESLKMIRLFDPQGASDDVERIGSIMQQIRIPGSRYAMLLNKRERSLKYSMEPFGDNDHYINDHHIIRALSGNESDEMASSLSPVLQLANLATLVKNFFVTPQQSLNAVDMLQHLDGVFAEPFARDMQTQLQDETFSLGLSIRTQTTIAVLRKHQHLKDSYPDDILAQIFYDPPAKGDGTIEDLMHNGELVPIAGAAVTSSKSSKASVMDRIHMIRDYFLSDSQAQAEDELVDFDALEEHFPWDQFVADITQWTYWRANEIQAVVQENDLDSKVAAIRARLDAQNGKTNTNVNIAPPVSSFNFASTMALQKDRNEDNSAPSSVRTLYKGPNSVHTMLGFPQDSAFGQAASSLQTPNNKTTKPARPSTLPARITDNLRKEVLVQDTGASGWTVEEVARVHKDKSNERNKENRKPTEKKRLVDRQAGAQRIEFTEEDSQVVPGNSTQKRPASTDDFNDESDDGSEAFQEDNRIQLVHSRSPPAKRSRSVVQQADESAREIQQKDELVRALQRNKDRREKQEFDERQRINNDVAEEEEAPQSTYAEVNRASKQFARAKIYNTTQKRVPWTQLETESLKELIGRYGSNWATIAANGSFHPNRGQVGLKDKARNMKVDYLRLGVMLPDGFNSVALGQKEIDKVKAVGRNPYRQEGEVAGDEYLDMNGHPKI